MARVLVVDDDCTSQLILKKMVEGFGYDCDIASNGQEAVEAASTHSYLAIVMDMFMPVLGGCDAAASITRRAGDHHPTIVGMISIDEGASRVLCQEAGMQEVLCKPIQRASLGQCLHRIKSMHTNLPESSQEVQSNNHQREDSSCTAPKAGNTSILSNTHVPPRRALLRRRSSESFEGESLLCPQQARRLSSPSLRRL